MGASSRRPSGSGTLFTGDTGRLPRLFRWLFRLFPAKSTRRFLQTSSDSVQNFPRRQLSHLLALSIIAQRIGSCTTSDASGVRSAINVRPSSEFS